MNCRTTKDLPEDMGLRILRELNGPLGLAAMALPVEGSHVWSMLFGSGGSCVLLFSDVIMPRDCRF